MEGYQAEGLGIVGVLLYLALIVFFIAVGWKIFTKAGKPGWAAIVPIYNIIVMLEIVNRPLWWIILMFIPIANIVVSIVLAVDLAKSFGKGLGYAIGLILLPIIFYPVLAFGSAQYTPIQH